MRQVNEESTPMNVVIRNGSVKGGTVGAVFDNDGGFLTVDGLEVSDITAPALIATANGGVSFLEGSTIRASTMEKITFTTAQGAQSVRDTTVTEMISLRDAFYVEEAGSSLTVTTSTITGNVIGGNTWRAGVTVLNGAVGTVSETTFSDNSGVEFGVAAGGQGSTLTLSDSIISGNTGVVSWLEYLRLYGETLLGKDRISPYTLCCV